MAILNALLQFGNTLKRKLSDQAKGSQTSTEPSFSYATPDYDITDPSRADAELSGWFNYDSAELFGGFRISAEDIVLDVGSGDSPYLDFCAEHGAAVVFADIDAGKICSMRDRLRNSQARSIGPIVGDAAHLPIKKDSMSKVIAMEVMEHVDDPEALLRELLRVGRPGATYLITVPDPESEKLQKELAPDCYFKKPYHIQVFSRDEFVRLVEKAGFIIERKASFGFYWSIWWVLFWACRQDLSAPWHPLLQSWTKTWGRLLNMEDGPRIKKVLDSFLPKSQAIIAKKP